MGGVDDWKIVFRSAIVTRAEVGEDQSVPAGILDIFGASAAAYDFRHLIKDELGEVEGFVLDDAV